MQFEKEFIDFLGRKYKATLRYQEKKSIFGVSLLFHPEELQKYIEENLFVNQFVANEMYQIIP